MSSSLTIAIPTYNANPEHLLEALESLDPQVEAAGGRVTVVVVDNASDAPQAAAVAGFAARFPRFRFVRHEQNLGFDRNVLRVLDSVHSNFVWFFGDDDILYSVALDEVLAAIDGTPQATVVLSRAHFFHETGEVTNRTLHSTLEPVVLRGADFVYRTSFTAAALSTFCVSAPAMRGASLRFSVGSNWVHFAALLVLFSDPEAVGVLLDEPLLAVRRSNSARWFANFGNQYSTGIAVITMIRDGLVAGVTPEFYEFFRRARFANNPIDILTLAWPLTWASRRRLYVESRQHFGGFWRFRLLDAPLLFIPNWSKASFSAAVRVAGAVRRRLAPSH